MRFLSELNGREFTYGGFNSSDYGLIFANYKSDFETKMGGSYESQKSIPMHGLRFGVLQQKYKEPYSGEFEIVRENGVLTDTEAETIHQTLFMDEGRTYQKLRYNSRSELSFVFDMSVNRAMSFNRTTNYIVLYTLPSAYRPPARENGDVGEVTFDVAGSKNDLILFIQSNGNVGVRTRKLPSTAVVEALGARFLAMGTYSPANNLSSVVIEGYNELQAYTTASSSPYTYMLPTSSLTSLSPKHIQAMATDASIIEGGYGTGATDDNGNRISTHAGWGTVGYKFTLTADSQYCWTYIPPQVRTKTVINASGRNTYRSGLVTTPPVIKLLMKNATTLDSGSNTISFSFGGKTTSITLPNAVSDTASSGAKLHFVIDSNLRRIYAEDHAGNLITTVVSDAETGTETPIANYFNGVFPAFAKSDTTAISDLSSNISSVTLGAYSIGDLL